MYIRQTRTNNKVTGEGYFTYRLVRGERIAGKVRQITLLNLGRNFAIKQEDWPILCRRIEQLLHPQEALLPLPCTGHIESAAQRYAGQLIVRAPMSDASATEASDPAENPRPPATFVEVDVDSLQTMQPRSVGVEHVGLHALAELGIIDQLRELGVNGVLWASIIGNLIGRMAHPGSERATWNWLQTHSALGELIDVDFLSMSHMGLYRGSDILMKHREVIEARLFGRVRTLFGLEETITLYDLTNTYFEGEVPSNRKAKRGRSKEKRSDCPLVTLGLVLDGSGFVRRSQTFEGNVSEAGTLAGMLTGLAAPAGALVIMDAGIASEANVAWLVEHGYRYLVVRRGGTRQFDETQAITIETADEQPLRLQKTLSEDGQELQLNCHSPGRQLKEEAMLESFSQRFEAGLQQMLDGLAKPRAEKRPDKLLERLGRLKQKSRGTSQHYTVNLVTDESGKRVTGITWQKVPREGSQATHPGVYCLRTNQLDWDEERLWRTYTLLTDLESVFRSLKSELGLRPIYHHKEDRADGHLFITVLAYQCVQFLRVKLKAAGIHDSWTTLRETLSMQCRTTTTFRQRDGRTLHVRKATNAEPEQMAIYRALGIHSQPGGLRKLIA
ncbi:MAG: IS1634 family transposase [Candidatus Accumulibacter meliphilus]|uniref:IS1634 family transposase n=1 Tax=Candidatus Accumulibacter meliphilus TaxID=2211374 RepID=UPI002FC2887B